MPERGKGRGNPLDKGRDSVLGGLWVGRKMRQMGRIGTVLWAMAHLGWHSGENRTAVGKRKFGLKNSGQRGHLARCAGAHPEGELPKAKNWKIKAAGQGYNPAFAGIFTLLPTNRRNWSRWERHVRPHPVPLSQERGNIPLTHYNIQTIPLLGEGEQVRWV